MSNVQNCTYDNDTITKVGNTDKNTNEERKGGLTMKNSILRCAGSRAEPSCHVKVIPISQ